MISLPDLYQFRAACDFAKVAVPHSIVRGLELLERAAAATAPSERRLLDLQDDEVGGVVFDLSVRGHQSTVPGYDIGPNPHGLGTGLTTFTSELLAEIEADVTPELDTIIEQLQPRFDEATEPIVRAVRDYGFTLATTADQVLEMRDEGASKALLDARDAWAASQWLVGFRKQISEIFHVAPIATSRTDYSVTVAANSNWSTDGKYNIGGKLPGSIDLFEVAAGGLRLNTVTEVEAKQRQRAGAEFGERRAVQEPQPLVSTGGTYPTA